MRGPKVIIEVYGTLFPKGVRSAGTFDKLYRRWVYFHILSKPLVKGKEEIAHKF